MTWKGGEFIMALPELGEGRAHEKGYLVSWQAPKPKLESDNKESRTQKKSDELSREESPVLSVVRRLLQVALRPQDHV